MAPDPGERDGSAIAPVPEWGRRPLWSVMIPTFNSAKYLRETLGSVLAQDPGPERMQIEVVDAARPRTTGGGCKRDWAGPDFISSETDKRGSRTQFP